MFLIAADINEDANRLPTNEINKKITTYEDNKDTFINELDEFTNNVSTWENNVVDCRTNNIPVLMSNVNALYEIHRKYAYEQFKKLPSSFEQDIDGQLIDCIKIKDKVIPLDKSQPKFIKNAIKMMLDI